MSSRRCMIVGVLLFALLPCLALGLDRLGKIVRAVPVSDGLATRVIMVETARELWETYQDLSLRGRILFHFGRHLHYVQVPSNELYTLDQGAVSAINLTDAYQKRVNNRNYLWIAAYDGTFRTIRYLLPENDFHKKAVEGGVGAEDEFTVYDSGFPRVISQRFPTTAQERPVVHIDAAWLESHSPEEVAAQVKTLPVRPDIITLSMAKDDPECLPLARERMTRLKELLADAGI